MAECIIDVELLSYWQAGSGTGRGAEADAETRKDDGKLPFIPGRTIKGLLREAVQTAEDFNRLPKDWTTENIFGKEQPGRDGGLLKCRDAVLPDEIRHWLLGAGHDHVPHLYHLIAATALDDRGLARDKTLRNVEVCIPMQLEARISCDDDAAWTEIEKILRSFIGLVRNLGYRRRRGLGRCRMTLRPAGLDVTP